MNKNSPKHKKNKLHRPFYRQKIFIWPVGVIVGLAVLIWLAFVLSPWPSALLIRHVFTSNSQETLAALRKHTPTTPITVTKNQQYQADNKNAYLDVYTPTTAVQANSDLPVVIWTHGGAWVSGDKANTAPYFKLLAEQGFTVVSLNYTLAPEKKYPAQIFEINAAHTYIMANAKRFHIDPNKVFLAGDSAGSQLSAQMAALVTSSAYAKEVGIKPALQPAQMAGVVLFCGIYKMEGLTEANPNLPKLLRWGDDQVVWAFSGSHSKTGPLVRQMSPYYHVTKEFPATFISGGNGDPLTAQQSTPLAKRLEDLGVPLTSLFFEADHQPSLPHEYQFNLDTSDGQQALSQVIHFLQQRSAQ